MKKSVEDFSLFGGAPLFEDPVIVGQLYAPDWNDFESSFNDIFDRRFFTNHGPLVCEFDEKFADYLGVKHAISVTNGTVALMVACRALGVSGEVIVPSFTFPATVQALAWADLRPVFCDVDPITHTMTASLVAPLITDEVSAVLGMHTWGTPCDPDGLGALCDAHGIQLFFDAAHAIGCSFRDKKIGNYGSLETFSFHATKILNGAEGGCIVTNDDDLAQRVRTIRNFHSLETFARVDVRINGKMTEAQAAMALLSLKQVPRLITRNEHLYEAYRSGLASLPGVHLYAYHQENTPNYQYCVVEIDEQKLGVSVEDLVELFVAEGVVCRRYFRPGMHNIPPFNEMENVIRAPLDTTDELCQKLIQFPLGATIDVEGVEKICDLFSTVYENREEIKERIGASH